MCFMCTETRSTPKCRDGFPGFVEGVGDVISGGEGEIDFVDWPGGW